MPQYTGYSGYGGFSGGLPQLAQGFMRGRGTPSFDERLAEARRQIPTGRQEGDRWVWPGVLSPYSRRISNFVPQQYADPWAGPENALLQAFLRDADVMQGAADRQYSRLKGQSDLAEGELKSGLGFAGREYEGAMDTSKNLLDRFLGAGTEEAGRLQGAADDFAGRIPDIVGPAREQIRRGSRQAEELFDAGMSFKAPDLEGPARDAANAARASVNEYRQAIAKYERDAWSEASSIAEGIRSQFQDAERMATGAMNPDGSMKTSAQAAADRFQFTEASQRQVSSVMSEWAGRVTSQVAEMQRHLANLGLQAAAFKGQIGDARAQEAALKLSGLGVAGQALNLIQGFSGQDVALAGLEGDLQSRVADLTARAAESRLAYDQLAGSWAQVWTGIRSSFPLQQLALQMQGRQAISEMMMQNPESVVSWYEGLLGLYSAMAAARGTTRV